MTTPVLKPANTDLVAVAWARRIPALTVSSVGVASELPADDAEIRAHGFVTALHTGGGSDLYVPVKRPVITFSAWAAPTSTGSRKTPWGRAASIAEDVWLATFDRAMNGVLLDLSGIGSGFRNARVQAAMAISDPRRIYGDPDGFARFDVDVRLDWRHEE